LITTSSSPLSSSSSSIIVFALFSTGKFKHLNTMLIQKFSRISQLRSPSKFFRRSLSTSPWADFDMAPVDPIVGLNEIFQKDDFPSKVIVGVGSYRDEVSLNFYALYTK
jgi:hypothetical protein